METRNIKPHLLPILGAIAGDVIGAPYELKGCRIKTTDFPLFCEKSTFTDDTVLTLAIAKWICNQQSDLVKIVHDLGKKYINVGFGHGFKVWLRDENPKPYNSYGNGSAMRVSSVAVSTNDMVNVKWTAKQTADITHNHTAGEIGAQAVAAAIYLAYNGFSKLIIKDFIEHYYYNLDGEIDEIRKTYQFDASCPGSVPQAILAFLESDSVEHAIRLAVSLGGDADTQASIAGAIAAAYYKTIPNQILDYVLGILPEDLNVIIRQFNDFIPQESNHWNVALESRKEFVLHCNFEGIYRDFVLPPSTRMEILSKNKNIEIRLLNNFKEVKEGLMQIYDLYFSEIYRGWLTPCLYINKEDLDNFVVRELTLEDIL